MDSQTRLDTLLNDLYLHRAMLNDDGQRQYGPDTINQAIQHKYITSTSTELGNVLVLAHKGRKKTGLCGAYNPSNSALVNAVAVRCVIQDLQTQGYQITPVSHRAAFRACKHQEEFMAVARHTGFDQATVRRIFEQYVQEGPYPELRVYVADSKVEALKMALAKLLGTVKTLRILSIPLA